MDSEARGMWDRRMGDEPFNARSTDASRYDRSAAMAAPHSARIGPFACRRRPFSAKYFDQRLGISFTGWDPGRFDLNVQVNVSETQYLYKIILSQRR